jgi:hypothetical protein
LPRQKFHARQKLHRENLSGDEAAHAHSAENRALRAIAAMARQLP